MRTYAGASKLRCTWTSLQTNFKHFFCRVSGPYNNRYQQTALRVVRLRAGSGIFGALASHGGDRGLGIAGQPSILPKAPRPLCASEVEGAIAAGEAQVRLAQPAAPTGVACAVTRAAGPAAAGEAVGMPTPPDTAPPAGPTAASAGVAVRVPDCGATPRGVSLRAASGLQSVAAEQAAEARPFAYAIRLSARAASQPRSASLLSPFCVFVSAQVPSAFGAAG